MAMELDPVCGMTVEPTRAKSHVEHANKTYSFCSEGCAKKFSAEPAKYLNARQNVPVAIASSEKAIGAAHTKVSPESTKTSAHYICPMDPEVREQNPGACPKCGMALEPSVPKLSAASIEYTCPMHPEIIRSEPGSCPICGMALEPRTVSASEEENPELSGMTRRFWISVALTIPVLVLGMSDLIPGQPLQRFLSMRAIGWIQLLLATPVVLWGGFPFFQRGWTSIVNRSLNMFTLIALGTGTAYIYSVIAVLSPTSSRPRSKPCQASFRSILKLPPRLQLSFCSARCSNFAHEAGLRPRFARS